MNWLRTILLVVYCLMRAILVTNFSIVLPNIRIPCAIAGQKGRRHVESSGIGVLSSLSIFANKAKHGVHVVCRVFLCAPTLAKPAFGQTCSRKTKQFSSFLPNSPYLCTCSSMRHVSEPPPTTHKLPRSLSLLCCSEDGWVKVDEHAVCCVHSSNTH